jgi:hypothetical protein
MSVYDNYILNPLYYTITLCIYTYVIFGKASGFATIDIVAFATRYVGFNHILLLYYCLLMLLSYSISVF